MSSCEDIFIDNKSLFCDDYEPKHKFDSMESINNLKNLEDLLYEKNLNHDIEFQDLDSKNELDSFEENIKNGKRSDNNFDFTKIFNPNNRMQKLLKRTKNDNLIYGINFKSLQNKENCIENVNKNDIEIETCLLYTSPSPRD